MPAFCRTIKSYFRFWPTFSIDSSASTAPSFVRTSSIGRVFSPSGALTGRYTASPARQASEMPTSSADIGRVEVVSVSTASFFTPDSSPNSLFSFWGVSTQRYLKSFAVVSPPGAAAGSSCPTPSDGSPICSSSRLNPSSEKIGRSFSAGTLRKVISSTESRMSTSRSSVTSRRVSSSFSAY